MKKMMTVLHKALALCALACVSQVGAQTIRLNADSYTDAPVLPFALPTTASGDRVLPTQIPAGYVLRTGELISTDLKLWATREGWEFIWHPSKSWRTLRATQFPQTDVASASTTVVDILRDEGKPVRLRISEGNKVIEVISTEVKND